MKLVCGWLLLSVIATLGWSGIITTGAERDTVTLPAPVDTCAWAREVVAQRTGPRQRYIAGYARYGPLCITLGDPRRREVEAAAREFVWVHWRSRERAVAIVTQHSIEGEPSTVFLYVEPSDTGVWQVRYSIDRLLPVRDQRPPGRFIHESRSWVAEALHRSEPRLAGFAKRQTIDDAIACDPSTYLLSFSPKGTVDVIDF